MILLPEELLEQAERENLLLFIGEHITRDGEGLASQLAARVEHAEAGFSFPVLVQRR